MSSQRKRQKTLRRLIVSLALAALVVAGHGGHAFAGDCSDSGAFNFICTDSADPADSTQTLGNATAAVTVTTTSGFGIDTTTTGGDAFLIDADGGLTFTDTFASPITGAEHGIDANNSGAGALTITTTGPVVGAARNGIDADNSSSASPTGTDLRIYAGDVTGQVHGIDASNFGSGETVISSTGLVQATSAIGIRVRGAGDGLTVSATDITSNSNGIQADNLGTGDLSITTSGRISSALGSGITAGNGNSGNNSTITVESTSVVEGAIGITATQLGSGTLSVTNAGVVRNISQSSGDSVIVIANFGSGVDLDNLTGATVRGLISLSDDTDTFTNAGLWENTGTSDFGGDNDTLVNAAGGTIRVANDAAVMQASQWDNLESFENLGLLTFADGAVGDTLTLPGEFSGGGAIELDVMLGDSSSPADIFSIGGNVSGATTQVFVNNIGGAGAETAPGDGIEIITVGGTTDADDFALGAPAVGGVHQYDLALVDTSWYLQSTGYATSAFLYPAVEGATLALGRDLIGTLWERVGLREGAPADGGLGTGADGDDFGAWLRVSGADIDGEGSVSFANTTFNADSDTKRWQVQGGVDRQLYEGETGQLIGSIFAHWLNSDTTVKVPGEMRTGKLGLDGYGGGAALTWYGSNGLYVDLLAQATAYDADLSASDLGTIGSPDGWGIGTSIEIGYALDVAPGINLVPQGQLVYHYVALDEFTDEFGNTIDWGGEDSLEGRLGFAIEARGFGGGYTGQGPTSLFSYADVNIVHEFLVSNGAAISGQDVSFSAEPTSLELGGGINLVSVGEIRTATVYLDGDYRMPINGDGATVVQGTAGVRTAW